MIRDNLLYIGLNGYAGSGKDTVAKMLRTILSRDWESLEDCKQYYKSKYTNPTISATHNVDAEDSSTVLCIAFADQLKKICANIFGISVDRFYQNKSTAWICMNRDFQYTEVKPEDGSILGAEEYYDKISTIKNSPDKYWMTLRDVLVYIGTYVLQQDVNKHIFINIVRNTIREACLKSRSLKYVIVTDLRFVHEVDFIRDNNGITMTITRDDVKQLDNIAEHDLDDEDRWDYTIENNAGYDELFEMVWDIVHGSPEFTNTTVDLNTRDDTYNYLRLYTEEDGTVSYKLCSPYRVQNIYHSSGEISLLNPVGGPTICIGEQVDCFSQDPIVPTAIKLSENGHQFIIETQA